MAKPTLEVDNEFRPDIEGLRSIRVNWKIGDGLLR